MKTPPEISAVLREAQARCGLTQAQLREQAGVSQRTLTNVLSGRDDFKVSTLIAIADRLGLELLLVPKGAATALGAGATTPLGVRTRVGAMLARILGEEGPRER